MVDAPHVFVAEAACLREGETCPPYHAISREVLALRTFMVRRFGLRMRPFRLVFIVIPVIRRS